MVWSLALRSDDAKQDPVVYGTKFGVVFLAEGPRTASIQEGFDCFGLYHPGLERERDFVRFRKCCLSCQSTLYLYLDLILKHNALLNFTAPLL